MARYLEIVKDSSRKYQLLCANCNWIKAYENKELNENKELKNGIV